MEAYPINILNPSVFYICIDKFLMGNESGRLYYVYSKEPFHFRDIGQLFKIIDTFLDDLNFPQTSMISRSFVGKINKIVQGKKTVMEVKNEQARGQKGNKATFVVHVRYRQHASWQGEVTWVESKQSKGFRSALELLKLIDSALDESDAEEQ